MRIVTVLAVLLCVGVARPAFAEPTMKIDKKGAVNLSGETTVNFELKKLAKGQMLKTSDWLQGLKIAGKAIDVGTCTLGSKNAGVEGKIIFPSTVTGEVEVEITVLLRDGKTTVSGTAKVNLEKQKVPKKPTPTPVTTSRAPAPVPPPN